MSEHAEAPDDTTRPFGFSLVGDQSEWPAYRAKIIEYASSRGYGVEYSRYVRTEVGERAPDASSACYMYVDASKISVDRRRILECILKTPQLLVRDDHPLGFGLFSAPTIGDPSIPTEDSPYEALWTEAEEWARTKWGEAVADGNAYSEVQATMEMLRQSLEAMPHRVRPDQGYVRSALFVLLNEGVSAIEAGGEFGDYGACWKDPPEPLNAEEVAEANRTLLADANSIPFNLRPSGHPLLDFYGQVHGLWDWAARGADMNHLAYVLEETCRVYPVPRIVEVATGEGLWYGSKVLHDKFRTAFLLSEKHRSLAELVGSEETTATEESKVGSSTGSEVGTVPNAREEKRPKRGSPAVLKKALTQEHHNAIIAEYERRIEDDLEKYRPKSGALVSDLMKADVAEAMNRPESTVADHIRRHLREQGKKLPRQNGS